MNHEQRLFLAGLRLAAQPPISLIMRENRPLPKPPQKRVVASAANFCVAGKAAVAGQEYQRDQDIAESLIAQSKASLA